MRLRSACDADKTRILFCTTGILLRKLQDESFLAAVSHIVVDEVHERQVDSDFLMAMLRQLAPRHPHLRVVFMSATIQESLYASYLGCPIVHVQVLDSSPSLIPHPP